MPAVLLLAVALGVLAVAAGRAAIRASGAAPDVARRYAAAREYRVGDIASLERPPDRPVRVVGRVRCPDPIRTAEGDTLVAYHRDVEVNVPGKGWRTIDRVRESRSFELWDHDGSLSVDPSSVAEPLATIPHVWRGAATDLDPAFAGAVERLTRDGRRPSEARAVTRTLSTVDRLGVLAEVHAEDGRIRLAPPEGGHVISNLALDAAMRALAGPRRRLVVAGYAAVAGGALLVLGAVLAGLVDLVV